MSDDLSSPGLTGAVRRGFSNSSLTPRNTGSPGRQREDVLRALPGDDAMLPQLEQRLQEIANRLARLLGGGGIAADMRVEFDAGILVAERRLRIGIHQHAAFAFPDVAVARGLGVGGDADGGDAEQAGIEAVREVGYSVSTTSRLASCNRATKALQLATGL